MKNVVFWDIKPQFVLHRRHYVSAAEASRLMLCKIWGFHGGDYEERRLLRYKGPIRTSQETHYVSATELRLDISLPSHEDGNRPNFRDFLCPRYLEIRRIDKTHKPMNCECYTSSSEPLNCHSYWQCLT
jgi:hypothetical protein